MVRHKNISKDTLESIGKKIKKSILVNSFKAGACHIGSALSCVEILVDLYWNRMRSKDVFVFSKASGVAALYAVLAEKGKIKKEKVAHYLKNYPLANKKVPGVKVSSGSLGHGLPIAIGLALGNRDRDVYVLLGDAEVQEGTFWESMLFKRQHHLKNLKIIVDNNGLQACGNTEEILEIPEEITGVEMIKTTKGRGVDFMEDRFEWHYKNLDLETLEEALAQI